MKKRKTRKRRRRALPANRIERGKGKVVRWVDLDREPPASEVAFIIDGRKITLPAMTVQIRHSKIAKMMEKGEIPIVIDLTREPTPPLKAAGDYRDSIVTIGTYAVAIAMMRDEDGAQTTLEHNQPIVVVRDLKTEKKLFGTITSENLLEVKEDPAMPPYFRCYTTAPLLFDDVSTWMSPRAVKAFIEGAIVDPKQIYRDILDYNRHHVDLSPDERRHEVIAAWIVGTHFYDLFPAFPYLHTTGPYESGKTRQAEVISLLSFLGNFTVNPTEATMFRTAEGGCTLCIDEAERFYSIARADESTLRQRAVINSGYRKGAKVPRTEEEGGKRIVRYYDVYCPKLLASIRDLERVTATRFIKIRMRKTTDPAFSGRTIDKQKAKEIRDKLYVLRLLHARDVVSLIGKLRPQDFGISNRAWELWSPLLTVAKALDLPHEDMLAFIRDEEERRKGEALAEDAALVIVALLDIAKEHADEDAFTVENKKVAAMLEAEGMSQHEVDSLRKRIGWTLRELGFRRVPKGRQARYEIRKSDLEDWAVRYGISPEEGAEPSSGVVLVEFLQDVREFVGPDAKTFGPCAKGTITAIPAQSARIFERRGVVKRVLDEKEKTAVP